MKSLDRSFLEQQSIPLEFAGTLRLLGDTEENRNFIPGRPPRF